MGTILFPESIVPLYSYTRYMILHTGKTASTCLSNE
jgi:hypothetical protein